MFSRWHELRPPPVYLGNDIRWVLLAAFADHYPEEVRPDSPGRALRLIQQFHLMNQVTSRLSSRQLADALTTTNQTRLCDVARRRTMHSLAVAQARELACRAADEAGVDIVLLKQAALEVMGLATPAQRFASDVDVLIDPKDIQSFAAALTKMACVARPRRNPAYHPVVFRTPADISVEIHTAIPYVRELLDGPYVDIACLKRRGWLSPVRASHFAHAWTAHQSILAAHLVAHSLAQHRFTPHHHSAFRAVIDARCVGLDQDETLAADAYGLIQSEVDRSEYDALLELIRDLRRGQSNALSEGASRLLRHCITSSIDERYQNQLLVQREVQVLREHGVRRWMVARAQRAFHPTEEELSCLVPEGAAENGRSARNANLVILARRFGRAIHGLFDARP